MPTLPMSEPRLVLCKLVNHHLTIRPEQAGGDKGAAIGGASAGGGGACGGGDDGAIAIALGLAGEDSRRRVKLEAVGAKLRGAKIQWRSGMPDIPPARKWDLQTGPLIRRIR